MSAEPVIENGGCHCTHVGWRVEAPPSVVAWECKYSDCSMRGSTHFIVPSYKFKLLGDSEHYLTTYTFGTHTAKHMFCKVCGITSFYIPRLNTDGMGVTVKYVDDGTLEHMLSSRGLMGETGRIPLMNPPFQYFLNQREKVFSISEGVKVFHIS